MPSYSGIWSLPAQMQAIAAGTWTGLPLAIGDAYEGGFYAGQISTAGNGIADYNLVVGPLASAQTTSVQFKTANTNDAGAVSVIDGPTNSSNMNDAAHPAAQFCEAVTTGGFTDWYMPAQNELEVCYYNLKPGTSNNNTSSGINANAVPARASNYTNSPKVPDQTSAANFQSTGAEDFIDNYYWSSTQFSAGYAWQQRFSDGNQYRGYLKTYSGRVRAIRRVAV